MENLWKGTVTVEFGAICPMHISTNVHARKLGEISVFYAVPVQQAAYQIRRPTTSFCNQSALKKTITPEDFKIHLLLLDMSEVL